MRRARANNKKAHSREERDGEDARAVHGAVRDEDSSQGDACKRVVAGIKNGARLRANSVVFKKAKHGRPLDASRF